MTRVVKIGGRAQGDAALPAAIAHAWAQDPGALCVVHGGGDEISSLQRALGVQPEFVGGRRITTARDLELTRMALSATINKRLVAALVSAGVRAVGISGEDASLIAARPVDPATMGLVGTPERINVALLWQLLDGSFLPVISPVSRDWTSDSGSALNVNGDDAAAALAVALGAQELFFMADVEGVRVNDTVVATMDGDDALTAIADGTAAGGMAAKLQAGLAALEGGVERVRIGSIAALNDSQRGTMLVAARSFA